MNRPGGDRHLGTQARRHPARAALAELLGGHGLKEEPRVRAAVLLFVLEAKEADLRRLAVELAGKFFHLLPTGDVRLEFPLHEPGDGGAKGFVLLGVGLKSRAHGANIDLRINAARAAETS